MRDLLVTYQRESDWVGTLKFGCSEEVSSG